MEENNRIPCYKKTGSGDVKSDTTHSSSVSLLEIPSNQSQGSSVVHTDSLRNIRQVSVSTKMCMNPPTPQRAVGIAIPTPLSVVSSPQGDDTPSPMQGTSESYKEANTSQAVAVVTNDIATTSTADHIVKAKVPLQPFVPTGRAKIHNKIMTPEDMQISAVPTVPKVIRVPVSASNQKKSCKKPVPDTDMQNILDSTLPLARSPPQMELTGVKISPQKPPARGRNWQPPGGNLRPIGTSREDEYKAPRGLLERIKLLEAESKIREQMLKDEISSSPDNRKSPEFNQSPSDRFLKKNKALQSMLTMETQRGTPSERSLSPVSVRMLIDSVFESQEDFIPLKMITPRCIEPVYTVPSNINSARIYTPTNLVPLYHSKTETFLLSPKGKEIQMDSFFDSMNDPHMKIADVEEKDSLEIVSLISTSNSFSFETPRDLASSCGSPTKLVSLYQRPPDTFKLRRRTSIRKLFGSPVEKAAPKIDLPAAAAHLQKNEPKMKLPGTPEVMRPMKKQPVLYSDSVSDVSTIELVESTRSALEIIQAINLEERIYSFVDETLADETKPEQSPEDNGRWAFKREDLTKPCNAVSEGQSQNKLHCTEIVPQSQEKPQCTGNTSLSQDKPKSTDNASKSQDEPHSTGIVSQSQDKPHSTENASKVQDEPRSSEIVPQSQDKPQSTGNTSLSQDKPQSTDNASKSQDEPHSTGIVSQSQDKPHSTENASKMQNEPRSSEIVPQSQDKSYSTENADKSQDEPYSTGNASLSQDELHSTGNASLSQDKPRSTENAAKSQNEPYSTGNASLSQDEPYNRGIVSQGQILMKEAAKPSAELKTAEVQVKYDDYRVLEFLEKFSTMRPDVEVERLRLEGKETNKLVHRVQNGVRHRILRLEDGEQDVEAVKQYHLEVINRMNVQAMKLTAMQQDLIHLQEWVYDDRIQSLLQCDIFLYQRLIEQEAMICHQINTLEAELNSIRAMSGVAIMVRTKVLKPKPDLLDVSKLGIDTKPQAQRTVREMIFPVREYYDCRNFDQPQIPKPKGKQMFPPMNITQQSQYYERNPILGRTQQDMAVPVHNEWKNHVQPKILKPRANPHVPPLIHPQINNDGKKLKSKKAKLDRDIMEESKGKTDLQPKPGRPQENCVVPPLQLPQSDDDFSQIPRSKEELFISVVDETEREFREKQPKIVRPECVPQLDLSLLNDIKPRTRKATKADLGISAKDKTERKSQKQRKPAPKTDDADANSKTKTKSESKEAVPDPEDPNKKRHQPKILKPKARPVTQPNEVSSEPKEEELVPIKAQKSNRVCRKIPASVVKVEMPFHPKVDMTLPRRPREVPVPIICAQKEITPRETSTATKSNAKLRSMMTGTAILPDFKNNKMPAYKRNVVELAPTFRKPGRMPAVHPKNLPKVDSARANLNRRCD